MGRRLYYVDWLRVLAVLLLFPFHTWRVFNAGDPFYVKAPYQSAAINSVITFIDLWHMPLLFLLEGASTYFALTKRNGWQYLGERFKRLFVPLLFGWLALIPPQTWYGARFNSGYPDSFWHYLASGDFLVWNIQGGGDYYGGFGLGHLWFIMYLFFIAIFALPLLLLWKTQRGQKAQVALTRFFAHPASWLLVPVLFWIFEGLPSPIDGKSFFYFLLLFVMGYGMMADESFMDSAERHRTPALIIGIAIAVVRVAVSAWKSGLPDPSWSLAAANLLSFLGIWLILVGLLGIGKRLLDTPSKALSYLGEASYPLYILHQTVIVVAAFYLIALPGPWVLQWAVLFIVVIAGTFASYEVVRRVGILRFLFGMKTRAPEVALEPTPEAA